MPDLLVFGLGRVFQRYHLPAIQANPDLHLVGACDTSDTRRDWLAAMFPDLPILAHAEEILSLNVAPAVLIAVPPEHHAALTEVALRAGRNVLIEKPMGIDCEEAERLSAYARSKGLCLRVGFMRRFLPSYRDLRDRLKVLSPREIERVNFRMRFDRSLWSPVGQSLRSGRPGVLYDVASHQADLVRWLFGSSINRVFGQYVDSDTLIWEIECDNGVSIHCLAAHGPKFLERISVETKTEILVAEPYECFGLPRWAAPAAAGIAPVWSLWHLAFCKLSGRSNATATSFARQLTAFVGAIGHEMTEGATGADAVVMHRILDALHASCSSDHAWIRASSDTSRD